MNKKKLVVGQRYIVLYQRQKNHIERMMVATYWGKTKTGDHLFRWPPLPGAIGLAEKDILMVQATSLLHMKPVK